MPGLSSLQVNIKDQPHNLAWINKEEQALLKDLGGSGRPGPMGIPAYDDDDYDTDRDEDYEFDQEDISGGMGGDTGGGTGGGDSWGEPDDPNPEDFSWSASKGNNCAVRGKRQVIVNKQVRNRQVLEGVNHRSA